MGVTSVVHSNWNLSFDAFAFDPDPPSVGQPFNLTWAETNVGNAPTGPYRVTFTFKGPKWGDSSVQESVVDDPLEPGAVAFRTLTFTLATADDYELWLADPSGDSHFCGNVELFHRDP
jgi:hypothetical protein